VDKDHKLTILVFGAGAIGTYIGGSLALQSHQVYFLERPIVTEALRQRGLQLEINAEKLYIQNPRMVTSIAQAFDLADFDVGIFALKSFDTQTVLESIKPWREKFPPILCLQNGVENEPAIASKIGPEKVIAGTVTSAVGRRSAGDIVLERLRGVGLSNQHPISDRLAKAMQAAGLEARLYSNPNEMKWSKLLTNLIGNASSAILDMSPAEIFAHPGLYRLEITQLREALDVMKALSLRPTDLPGTPVQILSFGVRFLPLALSQPLIKRAVGGGRGRKMPSFHIDLHSGRGKIEVDYLNGAVVRFAEKNNLTAPANRLLNETLLGLTNGEIPISEFAKQPEKLLARWESQY
jgi:2-dehydropantoate 2-reductase